MPLILPLTHPVLEAQDAIKAILAARAPFADVTIQDGGPTEGEDITSDAFWFNDITLTDTWGSLGGQRRRTTFLIGFTIACRLYGDDERTTRARALGYFEEFLFALKENPNLSGTVQQVDDVTGTVGSAPVSPSEWGAWFTGSLSVTSKAY